MLGYIYYYKICLQDAKDFFLCFMFNFYYLLAVLTAKPMKVHQIKRNRTGSSKENALPF